LIEQHGLPGVRKRIPDWHGGHARGIRHSIKRRQAFAHGQVELNAWRKTGKSAGSFPAMFAKRTKEVGLWEERM
jgi:hypothetical protein